MRLILPFTALSLSTLACGGFGDSIMVPLEPLGPAGVSGSVLLEETFCTTPCVKATFSLPEDGEGLQGDIRKGTCDSPGQPLGGYLATSSSFSETVSMVSGLDDLRGSHCVQVHARTTLDAGVTDAPLACGNIR